MIFEFGNFCIDVDVERTKEFYDKHGKTVIEDCGCINCCNYYEAILNVSDKVKDFFNSLGIDPQKSPEATWWVTNNNGIAYYTICFHIVGTLLKPENKYAANNFHKYEIEQGFEISFASRIAYLEENFPQPCIQLEIDAYLPWVLD